MVKKYLIFLILVFYSFSALAQTGKISGNVLNEKNERLSGVSVKIVGAPGGVTTNVEGFYTLTLSVGQKYELEFSAVGYDKKSVSEVEIIAGQITHLDIVLAVTSKKLTEVTVTANRTNVRRETAASIIAFQKQYAVHLIKIPGMY